MPRTIKIRIGDVSIAIEGDTEKNHPEIAGAFLPFITAGQTDLVLRVRRGEPVVHVKNKVFESHPIWSLYRSNAKSAIVIYAEMPDIRHTLVFRPEFKSADLFFPKGSKRRIDPFNGPALELLMINYLAGERGAIVHGCGIEHNERGIIFIGESGTGKSTLAEMWDKEKGVGVLSDDRIIIRKKETDFCMYGTPWHGEAKFGAARWVKPEKIFFLNHGQTNSIDKANGISSVQRLLTCSFPPLWDAKGMEFTLEFFSELAAAVPCYDFSFTPDRRAIDYILNFA
jgi:hypothetical protein